MQRDSYLALDALYLQSQNALEVIELENEKYETLMGDFQSNVVNYTGTGEVATSLKNYVMRIRRKKLFITVTGQRRISFIE